MNDSFHSNMLKFELMICIPGNLSLLLWQVREEQRRLRPDLSAPITGEVLNEMVYTRQVVKEVLRFRPPAPMVPQVCPTPPLRHAMHHQEHVTQP